MRRGVKVTSSADTAVNSRLPTLQLKQEAKNSIEKIRSGAAGTNSGTYTINGQVCYHDKFGQQVYALAWRSPPGDPFCYIESVIKKTGSGNNYLPF